jgi:hypothetical protein
MDKDTDISKLEEALLLLNRFQDLAGDLVLRESTLEQKYTMTGLNLELRDLLKRARVETEPIAPLDNPCAKSIPKTRLVGGWRELLSLAILRSWSR